MKNPKGKMRCFKENTIVVFALKVFCPSWRALEERVVHDIHCKHDGVIKIGQKFIQSEGTEVLLFYSSQKPEKPEATETEPRAKLIITTLI